MITLPLSTSVGTTALGLSFKYWFLLIAGAEV
jgi:hypothetical protein